MSECAAWENIQRMIPTCLVSGIPWSPCRHLRFQPMISLRLIQFLFSIVKPISLINLRKVIFFFEELCRLLPSVTVFCILYSIGTSLFVCMLSTFRRMARTVKLSCLRVCEPKVFMSWGLFYGGAIGLQETWSRPLSWTPFSQSWIAARKSELNGQDCWGRENMTRKENDKRKIQIHKFRLLRQQ